MQMIRRRLLLAISFPVALLWLMPAANADGSFSYWWSGNSPVTAPGTWNPTSAAKPFPAAGAYPGMVAGSPLTRPNDTTAYSANQTVCAAKSVTACVPGTISIASVNGGRLIGNRVTLFKSGSAKTNASFTIWFYSGLPGLAVPTQFDSTPYTGPRSADGLTYLGNAACTTGTATSDTSPGVWYECTLSNPNTAGALDLQAVAGTLNVFYLISATAAYTPAANETFTPYVGGIY